MILPEDISLAPLIIAVLCRWSPAVPVTIASAKRLSQTWRCVAVPETEEDTKAITRYWEAEMADKALFVIPSADRQASAAAATAAVIQAAKAHPGRPTAVLLTEGEELSGRDGRRWCREIASHLDRSLSDVQVYEYSSDWRSRPPRVR